MRRPALSRGGDVPYLRVKTLYGAILAGCAGVLGVQEGRGVRACVFPRLL